ncbi:MAG: pseudouridine-5'-phosphate glycosidase, partial [bacterium]|nr:pseudouridine-5'-phosphate glycosidase [bacterium]
MERYLDILPEVRQAVLENRPVVALESTILSHGMPYPENLAFAKKADAIIRSEGAVPATMAIIGGRVKAGLTEDELELLCQAKDVGKVSRRDMATYIATGRNGATTVATTMICSAMAGVRVFATGGIGGVHRHGEVTMDVSADLQELAHTPVAVVCAGAKQILDIGRTLEYLETMGVPVIGNGTADFPAFYCRRSGFPVDYAARDEEEIASIIHAKWALGLSGGVLIGNPIPEEYGMDNAYMESIIDEALA